MPVHATPLPPAPYPVAERFRTLIRGHVPIEVTGARTFQLTHDPGPQEVRRLDFTCHILKQYLLPLGERKFLLVSKQHSGYRMGPNFYLCPRHFARVSDSFTGQGLYPHEVPAHTRCAVCRRSVD